MGTFGATAQKVALVGANVFSILSFCVVLSAPAWGAARTGTSESAPSSVVNPAATTAPSTAKESGKVVLSSLAGKSLHLSCDRSLRDLEKQRIECFGNVYLRRSGDLLMADYATVDLHSEQLHAEGNVVYLSSEMVLYGAKLDYNFITETGVIEDGRVESDKFELLGEKIEKIGKDHFLAFDGEYSTCKDCPESWKLFGRKVDLTIDGYAYLNQVYVKINDSPTLFFPYAVIPVKTRRQTGLLFPRIQPKSENGFVLVQPFFWAISRSMDATVGAGFYSLLGPKGEFEYRYRFSDRTYGRLNSFFIRDKKSFENQKNRWAFNYGHNILLPFGVEQKISYLDASDRDYSRKIGDIPGTGEPALVSELGLGRATRTWSAWFLSKRIRNNLTAEKIGFDRNTVQLAPELVLQTTDQAVVSNLPLYWGFSAVYSRFWRTGQGQGYDPIDQATGLDLSDRTFVPGVTPLRRAERLAFRPSLYYAAKLGNAFEIIPSIEHRSFLYYFDKTLTQPTSRNYLLGQVEVSTAIERVYSESVKHKFKPSLTYSNIPLVRQSASHPFIRQIEMQGAQFDERDIVPISNEQLYFVPLGNSLSYRLSNKFILKNRSESEPDYRTVLDLTSGQSVNFTEFRKAPLDRQPFSRFFSVLSLDARPLGGSAEYYYYPYRRASIYNLSLNYTFQKFQRKLLTIERSLSVRYNMNQVTANSKTIGGGLNWSLNDYFALNLGVDYRFPISRDFVENPGVLLSTSAGLVYQSPSQCYKVVLTARRTIDSPTVKMEFAFPVNLTGEGFSNLQDGGGLVPAGTGG